MIIFGILLEEIMKKYKIKGKNLSIASNLTEGFISDIKKGKTLPSFKSLNKIIENLNIDIEDIDRLVESWEKASSPISFVKKFEKLELNQKFIGEFLNLEGKTMEDKIQKLMKINKELKEEIESLIIYKEFYWLVHEDDLNYILRKLSIENTNENILKLSTKLKRKSEKKNRLSVK